MVVPLTRETPYDPLKDFIPLYAGISASNAHYVAKDSPYTTFEEFLEVAKANKLSMGVNNLCAPLNLSAVQMASEFWLEFKTIALKTVPATLAGLIGGQVDVAVGQVASIHAYGDEIRPLIILDNTRKPYYEVDLPGVRTIGEAFPGKTAGTWVHGGLAAKAGTPQEIVDKLLAASETMGSQEFISKIPKAVSYDWTHGVAETTALIQSGIDLYSPLLDGLGLLMLAVSVTCYVVWRNFGFVPMAVLLGPLSLLAMGVRAPLIYVTVLTLTGFIWAIFTHGLGIQLV